MPLLLYSIVTDLLAIDEKDDVRTSDSHNRIYKTIFTFRNKNVAILNYRSQEI